MKLCIGRHVYGLAAIAFGVIALVWGDFNTWQQIRPLGNVAHRDVLLFVFAAFEILGGVAIQSAKTVRYGAAILGAVYLVFALLWLPIIVGKPAVFDGWGNFFEQFSLVSAALVIYGTAESRSSESAAWLSRAGCTLFGLCVVSFMLEQLFYLPQTAAFVPKWIPLGQMFWAITTTVAFALAAVAILSGRAALIASRLLTAMVLLFGLLVWLPMLFADPHKLFNWAGNAENLAIAGAAWVVADFLQVHNRRTAAAMETTPSLVAG